MAAAACCLMLNNALHTSDIDRKSFLSTPDTAQFIRLLLLVGGLATLWAFTHRFLGLALDGELYAVQALARLQPNLRTDLYLQNTSQDQYTVFSPIYAFFMRGMGVLGAATLLFGIFTLWLFAAARSLAASLFGPAAAWLSVAGLIIVGGVYGPFSVFNYTENYLTARSLAEAMVVSAIASQLRGWRAASIVLAFSAFAIHPIMALPGLLFVICVTVAPRRVMLAAAGGVILLIAVAMILPMLPHAPGPLRTISGDWYEVVLERSQFLFIQHWDRAGYEITLRAFVCLLLTWKVFPDKNVRRFCFAAILVGVTGLAVNAVGSLVSPLALLVQGQPWRWMWITTFCAILAVPPTMLAVLKDDRAGWLCALSLTLGWVYGEVDGLVCCSGALAVWLARERITPRVMRLLRAGTFMAALIVLLEITANGITLQSTPHMDNGREPLWVAHIREVFGLGIPAVLFAALVWQCARMLRSIHALAAVTVLLVASASFMLPKALKAVGQAGTDGEIAQFADWRQRIPLESNVLLYPPRRSAAFLWFTLQRPSYLTVDQSAGVVFSDLTAAEVRRRSAVLTPVADPDWRIYSLIQQGEKDSKKSLSAQNLATICQDPVLGFVIAQPSLGFNAAPFHGVGVWKDWNLYDCGNIRVQEASQ